MGIAVKVNNELVLKRFLGMEQRAANLRAWSANFGQYMKGEIDKNFAAGGRPTRWAPLKAGTMAAWAGSRKTWRTKSGGLSKMGRAAVGGRLPLTDKGLLRRSIFARPGPRSTIIACGDWKGAIHQFGAKIPPIRPRRKKALFWPGAAHPVKGTRGGRIPARPFLLFLPENIAYAQATLPRFVIEGK